MLVAALKVIGTTLFSLPTARPAFFPRVDLHPVYSAQIGHVPCVEPRAACIGNWIIVLKSGKRAIFIAAAHAQRAAEYLRNRNR